MREKAELLGSKFDGIREHEASDEERALLHKLIDHYALPAEKPEVLAAMMVAFADAYNTVEFMLNAWEATEKKVEPTEVMQHIKEAILMGGSACAAELRALPHTVEENMRAGYL